MSYAAVFFQVHPWDLARMEAFKRRWYLQAALRQVEREHERDRALLEALQKLLHAYFGKR